jgi:hypothetical protein
MIPDVYPKSRMASEHSGKQCQAKCGQGLETSRKILLKQRATENWNNIPSHVKNVKTVSGFKRSYKKTQRAGWPSLKGKKIWRQDGGMEHNTRKKALPERSQRDYWEFITKKYKEDRFRGLWRS